MNARMSLGRQPPPKPRPGTRNRPPIRASSDERLRQLHHVGAGRLADLGHRVDERDLGGQERVGGRLHQLGGGEVGHQQRDAGVESAAGRPRAASPPTSASCDTDDEPVRAQRVLDRVALAEELRVPGQPHRRRPPGTVRAQPRGEPGRGPDRARWTCRRPGRHVKQRGEAVDRRRRCRAVSAAYSPLRCGVLTQMKWTVSPRSSPPKAATSANESVKRSRPDSTCLASSSSKPGLEEGRCAGRSAAIFSASDVHAEDLVTQCGHGGGVYRAEISRADDRDRFTAIQPFSSECNRPSVTTQL